MSSWGRSLSLGGSADCRFPRGPAHILFLPDPRADCSLCRRSRLDGHPLGLILATFCFCSYGSCSLACSPALLICPLPPLVCLPSLLMCPLSLRGPLALACGVTGCCCFVVGPGSPGTVASPLPSGHTLPAPADGPALPAPSIQPGALSAPWSAPSCPLRPKQRNEIQAPGCLMLGELFFRQNTVSRWLGWAPVFPVPRGLSHTGCPVLVAPGGVHQSHLWDPPGVLHHPAGLPGTPGCSGQVPSLGPGPADA